MLCAGYGSGSLFLNGCFPYGLPFVGRSFGYIVVALPDLNRRPIDYESTALTTELKGQKCRSLSRRGHSGDWSTGRWRLLMDDN